MISMFKKNQVSWNKNTYWRDLTKETAQINLTENAPQLLFNWDAFGILEFQDIDHEKYLSTEFSHLKTNSRNSTADKTSLEDFEWGESFGSLKFPESAKSENFWPKMNGFQISGNSMNPITMQLFKFKFSRWKVSSNSSSWYKNENIDHEISLSSFQVYMINNYIDLNDINNPIKSNS